MNQVPTTQLYKIQHQKKYCFTIALDKETGTTFPVDILNQQVNALYDAGAGCSLINYSMYETLGIDPDKDYQPVVIIHRRKRGSIRSGNLHIQN